MKALYKLKGEVPTPKYYLELTNTEAEEAYLHGSYHSLDLCKRIPTGFHSREVTFEEWLNKYNIGVL